MQATIDLTQFYNPSDPREKIRAPFSDEQFTYATDGHIIIRVPRIPEITVPGGTTFPQWQSMPWDHDSLTDWKPLSVEIPEGQRVDCKSCDGTGKIITCQDCDGDGEVEYQYESLGGKTYDYDLECPVCEGRGKMNGDGERCEDCNGQGYRIEAVPVKIGAIGLSISNQLLQRVKDLPGLEIAVKGRIEDMPPVRFRFDGGCGIIMPMRDQGSYA
jgi:RecJ-like exonuclease